MAGERKKDAQNPAEDIVVNQIRIEVIHEFCTPEQLQNGFLAVKAREFTNSDGDKIPFGITLLNNQQIIVKTGLRFTPSPHYRAVVSAVPEHLIKNEIVPWSPLTIDGEFCIPLYCHGRQLVLKTGDTVALVCFERRSMFPVSFVAEKPSDDKSF